VRALLRSNPPARRNPKPALCGLYCTGSCTVALGLPPTVIMMFALVPEEMELGI